MFKSGTSEFAPKIFSYGESWQHTFYSSQVGKLVHSNVISEYTRVLRQKSMVKKKTAVKIFFSCHLRNPNIRSNHVLFLISDKF